MSASATASSYKPSPLGIGTPRSSPFRRPLPNPDSPASISSPLRNSTSAVTTPTQPSKLSFESSATSAPTSPTRVRPLPVTVETVDTTPPATPAGGTMFIAPQGTPTTSRESWTPRGGGGGGRVSAAAEVFQQQNQNQSASAPPPAVPRHATALKSGGGIGGGIDGGGGGGGVLQTNALAQLQPSQMRMLRDGFEVLDRDGDGVVNREDVADMMAQLGLPANPSNMTQFFPPSSPQTTTLAAYLNGLASALAALSPGPELLSAFSAFDDDDSGQADLAELRDALLHTAPDPGERALTAAEVDRVLGGFSGRRAFTKNAMGMSSKRGDVFRYQEFVGSVMGSSNGSEQASAGGAGA